MDQTFANDVAAMKNLSRIDHVILNAGILAYPNVCFVFLIYSWLLLIV